jgi:peptidoglycan/xylan/chitin deacetylase (PgdA/CDA1 family)
MTNSSSRIILNFHGIGTPHTGVDAEESQFWMSVDMFERVLDRVVKGHATGIPIELSFDDGNLSDFEVALPRLQARGLNAHFFVLVGRIGHPAFIDEEGILALRAAGMRVGLHGRQHLDWRKLDTAGLKDETVTAREELCAIIGSPVDAVAIPFGAYRRRTVAWLLQQGFTEIYTSDGGKASLARRIRPRTSLTSNLTQTGLEDILADRLRFLKRTRRFISSALRRNLI